MVPGIGGFLVHHEPAVADEQKGLIYPGRCRISFNAALKDNDGVLVKSYSDAFSFGYRRSLSIMEKDIEELRAQLLSSGVVEIGEVGKLVQSKGEMNLTFIPNPHHPFSIDYYGLRPVAMLPRPKAATKVPEQRAGLKGHIYYLPINLRSLGYGSVAAAMVAMAIFIPNQKLQSPSNVTQYQAGFLTEQVAEQKEEPHQWWRRYKHLLLKASASQRGASGQVATMWWWQRFQMRPWLISLSMKIATTFALPMRGVY